MLLTFIFYNIILLILFLINIIESRFYLSPNAKECTKLQNKYIENSYIHNKNNHSNYITQLLLNNHSIINPKLEYCNIDNMFLGDWCFHLKSNNVASYDECPITYKNYTNNLQKDKYCEGNISQAFFIPNNYCQTLHPYDSAIIIEKILKKRQILFIGDSLGGQQFIGTSCELEGISSSLLQDINYHWDVTLRPDLPCHLSCQTNVTFLNISNSNFPNPCLKCLDGKIQQLDIFSNNHWIKNVKKDETGK
jgi:hypothetical protein